MYVLTLHTSNLLLCVIHALLTHFTELGHLTFCACFLWYFFLPDDGVDEPKLVAENTKLYRLTQSAFHLSCINILFIFQCTVIDEDEKCSESCDMPLSEIYRNEQSSETWGSFSGFAED